MMSRPRLVFLGVAGLLALGFAGLGAWSLTLVEDSVHQSAAQQLRAVHSSDVASMMLWIRRKTEGVGAVAPFATRPALGLLEAETEEAVRDSRDELTRRAMAAGGFFGFDAYLVTTQDGVVHASTLPDAPIGQVAGGPIAEASRRVSTRGAMVSRPYLGPQGERRVVASAPMRSEDGAIVAVLHLIGTPEGELFDLLAVSRPGETGETYLYSRDGRMLSNSRFSSTLLASGLITDPMHAGGALELELVGEGGLPTAPVLGAQTGRVQGEPLEYVSYLGTPVLGVWTWIPELDAGVATELSVTEAFGPSARLRRLVALLVLLLGVMVLALTVVGVLMHETGQRVRRAAETVAELGQYQLLKRIGQGSMGTVYKARHRMLQRPTAVKVLRDSQQPRAIARFEREVRLTADLTHPNTVQVYDFGRTDDGRFYYAMEYLPGLDLRSLIEVYGRQPSDRVAHILLQIAASLREAHSKGLVHRDIKAANVILCERGGRFDVVKVLDFGLVVALSEGREGEKGLIGTPIYLAPELCVPPYRPSPRSDLYALGCLGYELLVGKPPFSGPVSNVVDAQRHRAPVPPSMRAEDVHPELEAVIMACLAKAPVDRPSHAGEVLARLQRAAVGVTWTRERAETWWLERDPTLGGYDTHDGVPLVLDVDLRDHALR